jgi:hypothetical protein
MAAGDSALARAWLLAEARRLQKRHEAIRRRLEAVRELMRIVCRSERARRSEP